jgi:hypothetical protein
MSGLRSAGPSRSNSTRTTSTVGARSNQTMHRDEHGDHAFIVETLARASFLCSNCNWSGAALESDLYQGYIPLIVCPNCHIPVNARCHFPENSVRRIYSLKSTLIKIAADDEAQKTYIKIFCCCGHAKTVKSKDNTVIKPVGRRLSFSYSREPVESERYIDMASGRCDNCDDGHVTCDNCVGLECSSSNTKEQHGEFVPKGSRTKRALSKVGSFRVRRSSEVVLPIPPTTPTADLRDNIRSQLADMSRKNANVGGPHNVPAPQFPGNSATATPLDFEPAPNFVASSSRGRFIEHLGSECKDGSVSPESSHG